MRHQRDSGGLGGGSDARAAVRTGSSCNGGSPSDRVATLTPSTHQFHLGSWTANSLIDHLAERCPAAKRRSQVAQLKTGMKPPSQSAGGALGVEPWWLRRERLPCRVTAQCTQLHRRRNHTGGATYFSEALEESVLIASGLRLPCGRPTDPDC